MPGSAATREAIRARDGWTLALWLTSPDGTSHLGKGGHKTAHRDLGPVRGIVRLDVDPAAEHFLFCRLSGGVVRLRFAQVVTWLEIAPPPRPLPVEEIPRP